MLQLMGYRSDNEMAKAFANFEQGVDLKYDPVGWPVPPDHAPSATLNEFLTRLSFIWKRKDSVPTPVITDRNVLTLISRLAGKGLTRLFMLRNSLGLMRLRIFAADKPLWDLINCICLPDFHCINDLLFVIRTLLPQHLFNEFINRELAMLDLANHLVEIAKAIKQPVPCILETNRLDFESRDWLCVATHSNRGETSKGVLSRNKLLNSIIAANKQDPYAPYVLSCLVPMENNLYNTTLDGLSTSYLSPAFLLTDPNWWQTVKDTTCFTDNKQILNFTSSLYTSVQALKQTCKDTNCSFSATVVHLKKISKMQILTAQSVLPFVQTLTRVITSKGFKVNKDKTIEILTRRSAKVSDVYKELYFKHPFIAFVKTGVVKSFK
ncbi:ORF30-like protein [Bufonid herpesvirus 1]|uniref:ORF30-like protein n=1 Tax=Bufonid herpesvirus 1 TaxID=2282206 RepID=UPI000EB64801|nr:ORF30-like protein [Bufonid herpesvirus 1]AXF48624.1 ORF30-like protein [Bufonid herpesvirus 1]